MDQLSQRSSSERTQFMSREDLDQEGSLDLDHEPYHYQDQDQDQYTDQELEPHEGQYQNQMRGSSTPTRTLELKVQDEETLFIYTVQITMLNSKQTYILCLFAQVESKCV